MDQSAIRNQMTKSTFTTTAQPIAVTVAGQSLVATPKQFSTGSVGFYVNGKVPVRIGDQTVMLQISGSFAAIGSKEWKP